MSKKTKNYEGQIVLIALVFFAVFLTISASLLGYVTQFAKNEKRTIAQTQALHLAEAGIDKAVYEINQNTSYTGENNTAINPGSFTVSVSSIDTNDKRITSTGSVTLPDGSIIRKIIKSTISLNSSVISFHYGIQAGNGGFTLDNSSSITGNVFAAGPVVGSGNMIYGDVISSGASGLIYGVHATGTAYSHTLGSGSAATVVDKDAYYVTKTNTTVTGTSHPGSADQSSADLPISDAQISEWEGYAEAGGIMTSGQCDDYKASTNTCTISTSKTIGPLKIPFNLIIKDNSGIVTIAGPVWITGNLTTQTTPTIKMAAALGAQNVAIIAHDPTATSTSGIITIGQSTVFQNSGTAGSFVFLISQNNSAETGGSTIAVNMSQGASALVAYASHGLLTLSQSVSVKEATGYKINLAQSANVTYDTGLPSSLFESGPGGSWTFSEGSYVIQ